MDVLLVSIYLQLRIFFVFISLEWASYIYIGQKWKKSQCLLVLADKIQNPNFE